jgi:hypothetical protein
MDVKLESAECLLLATLTGRVSLEEALPLGKAVLDMAAEKGFSRILFDCLALQGELSVVDRYDIGEGIAEYCKNHSMIPSVALLGKLPTVTGFCAQVAWNRGLDVKVFSERQAAREWLNRFGPQPRHIKNTSSRTLESKPALVVKIRLPRT